MSGHDDLKRHPTAQRFQRDASLAFLDGVSSYIAGADIDISLAVHYREPSPQFLAALRWLQPQLVPWRKLTIAVDGVDGIGKSPFARFLSWQTGMPCIETDVLFPPEASEPIPDTMLLSRLVAARHGHDRPVIVEGLFVLASLARAGVAADILIRVSAAGHDGSQTWARLFESYRNSHPRSASPDYEVVWQPQ